MILQNILPQIYKELLKKEVLSLNVTETKATCDNCLRARDKRFSYTYKPDLKCCTFHPFTPNYAVGAVLDLYPETVGGQKVKHKIFNKEFSLPIGLIAPFDYQLKFLTKEEEDFGNRSDLLCPYYDKIKNQCSIWEYRGVVCTSFYCRSDYGQDGQRFWAVLSDYLSYVEMALAEECLVTLDFSPRDISEQLMYLNRREFEANEESKTKLEPEEYKKIWIGYNESISFYKKCYEHVKSISRKQMKEILGQQGLELENEVIDYGGRRKK